MQLAVRYHKVEPAGRVATCEAAVRAVVTLLASDEATTGEWAAAVKRWRDGRIRKLVRRARGVRWDDVQQLPGVTVEQERAAVRAFVPGPVRPLPPELAKLQVSGTELPADEESTVTDAPVLIGVNPHIEMTAGKAAAQCAHAGQLAWEAMTDAERDAWAGRDFRVRVHTLTPAEWAANPGRIHVVDAGFTELDGPTETTRAWWRL
ncbi:peptidyl-tRNA hydrolase [Granulicoccus sp. GXG6511]|uniref:peptidyl-tRNA hydrolase n=1 Tax=Granulicoccus sp. GXG6511 TaxID=3381351 RepID=UPI003D7E7C56